MVELEGVFGADVLEFPPVILVQLIDFLHLVSPFDQMTVCVLLCVEDMNDKIDPWSDFTNLVEARSNPGVIHHVENFENQHHHLHLKWILPVCTDFTEHFLQSAQESSS